MVFRGKDLQPWRGWSWVRILPPDTKWNVRKARYYIKENKLKKPLSCQSNRIDQGPLPLVFTVNVLIQK